MNVNGIMTEEFKQLLKEKHTMTFKCAKCEYETYVFDGFTSPQKQFDALCDHVLTTKH